MSYNRFTPLLSPCIFFCLARCMIAFYLVDVSLLLCYIEYLHPYPKSRLTVPLLLDPRQVGYLILSMRFGFSFLLSSFGQGSIPPSLPFLFRLLHFLEVFYFCSNSTNIVNHLQVSEIFYLSINFAVDGSLC